MYIIFFNKVLIILRKNTKQAKFWLGVQSPLNSLIQTLIIINTTPIIDTLIIISTW